MVYYLVLIIYHQRSSLHNPSSIPHFSLSCSHSLCFANLVNIVVGLGALQQNVSLLGLGVGLNFVRDNKGYLRDFLNAMTYNVQSPSANDRNNGVISL